MVHGVCMFSKKAFPTEKAAVVDATDAIIRSITRVNRHQCTTREYRAIRDLVASAAPANFLVFGVGRDSGLWIEANSGGRTVFLENNPEWLDMARKYNPGIELYQVTYSTIRSQWRELLLNRDALAMVLPAEVLSIRWSTIFVDSPDGRLDASIGRMQSIYAAFTLKPDHVFVHDCDREVEQVYFKTFFGRPQKKVRKLWFATLDQKNS
jgi:hypothetical protein